MKRLIIILTFIPLMLGIASCEKQDVGSEDLGGANGRVMVKFASSLAGEVQPTKSASGNSWANNDQIGIFMVRAGQPLSAGSISEGADNVKYISNASGTMTAATNPIYYPSGGNQVNFIAYYPYNSSVSGYRYHISDVSSFNALDMDILYSNNVTNASQADENITLNFKHATCKLNFTFVAGAGYTSASLNNLNATFIDTYYEADLMLADGSLSTAGYTSGTIPLIINQTTRTASTYFLPIQTAGRFISFLGDGIGFKTWNMPTNYPLEAGKSYDITVTFTTASRRASMDGSSPDVEVAITSVKDLE